MRITKYSVILCCIINLILAAEEKALKKKDDRGKRNLDYQTSHVIHPSPYRLERRISTNGQYFSYPYRKDRPQSYPVPPYAVQMEPLVHYSQRDPLYDTKGFALEKPNDDLLSENNQLHQDVAERRGYIRYKTKIIEKPVYIKEPEPIIEIIIKESNVSLPAPPPPPPPPKKKKEPVQVFFVKYKKNPNGEYGKDSIIYDKPIPALSPKLPEDDEVEEEEAPYNYHAEQATVPPPPSTTLRTVIRPDSETYHSPSGIKVTFGKEGFDYEKRSSKPEEYVPLPQQQPQGRQLHDPQQPTGRQLNSFSNAYFKPPSPSGPSFHTSPGFRSESKQRQSYRPVSFPSSSSHSSNKIFGRPTSQQFASQQNLPPQRHNQQIPPQFSHSISHPPPTAFQNVIIPPLTRQPVPYKPFDNYRPSSQEFSQSHRGNTHQQQQIPFRPETHFSHQQLPHVQQENIFAQGLNHNSPPFVRLQETPGQRPPQFTRPQVPELIQQQSHLEKQRPSIAQHTSISAQPQFQNSQKQNFPAGTFNQQQNLQSQQSRPLSQPSQNFFQQNNFNSPPFQQNNLQHTFGSIPPGGELIQALPKYESHFSTVEQTPVRPTQSLSPQQYQEKRLEQFNSQEQNSKEILTRQQSIHQNLLEEKRNYIAQQQKQQERQQQDRQQQHRQQEQLRQYYLQNEAARQNSNQREVVITTPRSSTIYHTTKQSEFSNTTPEIYYRQSTEHTTRKVVTEAPTPSTTTKDPKILESQLPDEVPPELREQLLSSGILNNADISVLDYDKVGDIPLSALPPDQLANFFNAGGGQQIAGSEPVASIVDTDGKAISPEKLSKSDDDPLVPEASDIQEIKVSPPNPIPESKSAQPAVDLKVVHYDPETDKGKEVQEAYISGEEAKQVSPVVLNDESYTRYLPVKVNGSEFPIPDVPELKGKKISSVVVLAPVNYDFSNERKTREAAKDHSDVELIEGTALKDLLANPNLENYKKFLEIENKTTTDKQSVILLVADPQDPSSKEKEIFMYDVGTQTVNKLSGDLSSAFVEAAEANSNDDDSSGSASNVIENVVPYLKDRMDSNYEADEDLQDAASSSIDDRANPADEVMDQEETRRDQNSVKVTGKKVEGLRSTGS